MASHTNSSKILTGYSSFLTLSSLAVLTGILSSSSEPGSTIAFGLSLSRMVLATGLFFVFLLSFFITIKAWRDKAWAGEKLEAWFGRNSVSGLPAWLGGISFGLGWIGFFLPAYRTGWLENYWLRLQPVMLFTLLAGFATLVMFYIRQRKSPLQARIDFGIVKWSVALFLVCLPLLAFMLYSKFGISSQDDFWYGAGVPILIHQLIVAIIGGTLFLSFENSFRFRHRDLVIFILVFGVTAFLWTREPLQKGFSFIGPHPPNNGLYPFYDAAVFDIASQLPLIGQKFSIYGSLFFERPLYLSFLVYLHALFGQDYSVLMAVQAAVYAIFPALIYLIGRSLNLRVVGFTAALVAMMRGVNSIASSNMMDTAGPKMILTDYPAAIGIALVVLLTCEWLRMPKQKWHYALWIGGALGFTLMLRTNALMLLVLIPLYALFKIFPNWKQWLSASFLIFVGVLAITLPWELRNKSLGGQMYGPILGKFRDVINQRYTPPVEPLSFILPDMDREVLVLKSTQVISVLYQGGAYLQIKATCDSVSCFVPNHFLHNIVASILVMPTSFVMDDMMHTVRDVHPYWNQHWDGVFTVQSLLVLLLNLFIIILGIVTVWRKRGFAGIAPLAVFMFYNLSNAFARTSGGRYVVPMDWIVTIYFLLGVFQMIVWFANALGHNWQLESKIVEMDEHKLAPNVLSGTAIILSVLLGFGALIPLSEKIFPPRYEGFDPLHLLVENQQGIEAGGLELKTIESFLQTPNAEVLVGRALYPRFYKMGDGISPFYPTIRMPFPRMTFTMIDTKNNAVILPLDASRRFPHAGDVLVVGCREKGYIDALAVILLEDNGTVYTRNPTAELQCPLQQPVCDNNSNCK